MKWPFSSAHSQARGIALGLIAALAGCGTGGSDGRTYDFGLGGGGDLAGADLSGTAKGDMSLYGGPCDDTHPCSNGNMCFMGQCIPDNGTCTDDSQCENDSYCDCVGGGGGDAGACMGGVCLPYGVGPRGMSNPDCHGMSFSSSDFKPPVVKCSWTTSDVISTPLVIDLDLDGKPELVFLAATFDFFGSIMEVDLVALHGKDCTVVFSKPVQLLPAGQIAAADLDGDKFPEIVGVDQSAKVEVFDHTGKQLAVAGTAYAPNKNPLADCTGPAIVDIDGQAPPEIVISGQVLRYVKGQGLNVLFTKNTGQAFWGTVTAAADMDGDGVADLVTGNQVLDGKTGADKTPAAMKALNLQGAYPAVADFNADGKPDIVIVESGQNQMRVLVFDFANNKVIFGPYTVARTQGGNAMGGPPTVGDFDGDGMPDFALAGDDHYFVYALKCAAQQKPPECVGADPGTLWEKSTHDWSSGGTGSSVFDFNGDGKYEVVYRDECFFRVMDGTTGKSVFAQQISSGTCLEYPVIADVDGDGHADVVVPSDDVQGNYCAGATDPDTNQTWTQATRGLFVLTDPMNRWMPSRSIWNEHTYHITDVNDDGTVPIPEKDSWLSWNSYRLNVQGTATGMNVPQTDYTGGKSSMVDSSGTCAQAETLYAELCNRGTGPAPAPVPGTFYSGDPRMGGTKICTTMTTMTLQPGQCETLSCPWQNPPAQPTDVWFRADDDGSNPNVQMECDTGNDLEVTKGLTCQIPG